MDKIKVTDYEEVLATIAKYTDACKEGKSYRECADVRLSERRVL